MPGTIPSVINTNSIYEVIHTPFFLNKETKAQRILVTHPRSQANEWAEGGGGGNRVPTQAVKLQSLCP